MLHVLLREYAAVLSCAGWSDCTATDAVSKVVPLVLLLMRTSVINLANHSEQWVVEVH